MTTAGEKLHDLSVADIFVDDLPVADICVDGLSVDDLLVDDLSVLGVDFLFFLPCPLLVAVYKRIEVKLNLCCEICMVRVYI